MSNSSAGQVLSLNRSGSSMVQLLGMDWPYFLTLFIIVAFAVHYRFLPASLAGQMPLLLVIGEGLNFIGNRTPVVKDYLGGGSIVVLFGCSALVMFGVIPAEIAADTKTFMKDSFIDFALAALCCGSIFGMDRSLLIESSLRYIPCILGGLAGAVIFGGLAGMLLGYRFNELILYIILPIMGGGTSAGAVPMSQMYGEMLHTNSGQMLAIMTPAVAFGNACAIIIAGLLNKLGEIKPVLTGNGRIMRGKNEALTECQNKNAEPVADLSVFATGMAVSGIFMGLGQLIQHFVPGIHTYAWMILLMIASKLAGILPHGIERACALWFQFFVKNFTNVLLAGLGIGLISLKAVLPALSPIYLLIVIAVITGTMVGSGLVGYLVGFYPIEAAITSGLCMANMGGSGDIATLGAAKRMELMPFAAVSSRLGGALILILSGAVLSLLS